MLGDFAQEKRNPFSFKKTEFFKVQNIALYQRG